MIPYIWSFVEEALTNYGLIGNPTTSGTTVYVDGKIGKAIDCSASSVINFPDSDALNNDHHTICFWLKRTATGNNFGEFFLASTDGNPVNRSPLITRTSNNSNTIHFRYSSDGIDNLGPTNFALVNDNQWYHVVAIKNGPLIQIYIDGSLFSSTNINEYSIPSTQIRVANAVDSNVHLNDLRIYPSVLSVSEIKSIARGMIAHWKLDGHSNDVSGYNLHGTATNVVYSTPIRENDSVITDRYASFDPATNSQIRLIDEEIGNIKNLYDKEMSISLWFRTPGYQNNGSVQNTLVALNQVFTNIYQFSLSYGSTHSLIFRFNSIELAGGPFELNKWHHVVITKSHNSMKIFVNGVQTGSGNPTFNLNPPVSSLFTIGGDSITIRRMAGDISDVRIYATELDQETVTELYQTKSKLTNTGMLIGQKLNIPRTFRGADNKEYIMPFTTGAKIISFEDDNVIKINSEIETTLSALQSVTLNLTINDRIKGSKSFEVEYNGYGDAVPTSWRGYQFSFVHVRFNSSITLFSYETEVNYTIYNNSVISSTGIIPANSFVEVNIGEVFGNYYIEGNNLLSVYVSSITIQDTYPLFPIVEELYGIPSANSNFTSPYALTYKRYLSTGETFEGSILAHAGFDYQGNNSYASPSIKVIASRPIGGKAWGEGGGTQASPMAGKNTMAHKFVLPSTANWLAFVGIDQNATVKVFDSNNNLIGTETVTGGGIANDGEKLPTHLKITTDLTYLNLEGWYVICSHPMLCYFENSTGRERMLFGSKVAGLPTYSEVQLPTRSGVISSESIDEIGVSDGLIFYTPFHNNSNDYASYTAIENNFVGSVGTEPKRIVMPNGEGGYDFENSSGVTASHAIEYLTLPRESLESTVTVSCWINTDTTGLTNRQSFFHWRDICLFSQTTNNKISANTFDQSTSTWNSVDSITSIITGQWYHVLYTYDGIHQRVYINGVLDSEIERTITFEDAATFRITVGAAGWSGGQTEAWDGKISKCMIFNRALRLDEINTLYKHQSGLSAMQRLNDGVLVVKGISDISNG